MDWVTRSNIERFEKLIAKETDPERIRVLRSLLTEQQEKAHVQTTQPTS